MRLESNIEGIESILDDEIWELLRDCGIDFTVLRSISISEFNEISKEGIVFSKDSKEQVLKNLFWESINKCRKLGSNSFNGFNLYSGVVSGSIYNKLLQDKKFCCFLIDSDIDHDIMLLELLKKHGIDSYKKLLELDENDDSSHRQLIILSKKFDAIKRVEDRVKGNTHKIQLDHNVTGNFTSKNLSIEMRNNMKGDILDLDQVRKEIMKLECDLGIKSVVPDMPVTVMNPEVLVTKALESGREDYVEKAKEIKGYIVGEVKEGNNR